MNPDLKKAFYQIKPLCDALMLSPTQQTISTLTSRVSRLKNETVQEMQLYLLFPVVTHLKSKELNDRQEIQRKLVAAVKLVLDKVTITSSELFIKYHTCLLNLVFDKSKQGMVAQVSEELKLDVTKCLTALMLKSSKETRLKIFKGHVPLLAQTIFIAVHLAKLEMLRPLRKAAINCLTAYTGTHSKFTEENRQFPELEALASDMAASILPGVLGALQDVATSNDNPGHGVIVTAVNAIHKLICLVMHNKYVTVKDNLTVKDFVKMLQDRIQQINIEKDVDKKSIPKKTPEWFDMAGDKLQLVMKSLTVLQTHEHVKVRKELAVLCTRLLLECSRTMQPSIPYALNILISLTKDDYPEVSTYCSDKLRLYFNSGDDETMLKTMDSLADNFLATLLTLPRTLNNIDTARKLSSLNLIHGYISLLTSPPRPPRLTAVLSLHRSTQTLAGALLEAVRINTNVSLLTQLAQRDISTPPPTNSPWCKLKHIDDDKTEGRLRDICRLLGNAECADLLVDHLMDLFDDSAQERKEIVYLLNWIGSASSCAPHLTRRVLSLYVSPSVWGLPLQVGVDDVTHDRAEPAHWDKESVPGLYEGTVETRYTDISYATPRRPRVKDPNYCSNLAEAQNNMVLSCLLTEGVGLFARRLGQDFQPFLLKTLCLILERVGSKYEMLHLSGLSALHALSAAGGHGSAGELVRANGDYFTEQITKRLKKAWNCESALEILTVVMEYSDETIFDCLYGIVSDVLVQSCDKYHSNDLSAYLQVFLTFMTCIQKWFPSQKSEENPPVSQTKIDLFHDTLEFIKGCEDSERLLNGEEFEKSMGKSTEEMYREDVKRREEDLLDYDDSVPGEKKPLPQHITLTVTILKRCVNFIPSKRKPERILSLQIVKQGLLILKDYEDELLPMVHSIWSPLAVRFQEINEPVILRRALDVLVTMADLSKDFIRNRTLKEVLPNLFKFLDKSSQSSRLKDVGSAYRESHSYRLQVECLTAVTSLVQNLALDDQHLTKALSTVHLYLADTQPKPLQVLAVQFFRCMLSYDHGAAWAHLRRLCDNRLELKPPSLKTNLQLQEVIGSPYEPTDKSLRNSIQAIFDANS